MSYTSTMSTIAAIIPAAGLSSRMGQFKPLLRLNGFPMIKLAVLSALDGGVNRACVVTGHNANEIKSALACSNLSSNYVSVVQGLREPQQPDQDTLDFVHNGEYAASDMLQSIKLGLNALVSSIGAPNLVATEKNTHLQAVVILPGDMPGISPQTFAALQKARVASSAPVLVPTYCGRRGHPLLVSSECFDALLSFEGSGGLKEALSGFVWRELPLDDPAILLDADDQAAFAVLQEHVTKTHGVDESIINSLYAAHQTPPNVRAHCAAVAEVALRMARALNRQGFGLDSVLCCSGGKLHDLNRLEPCHSEVAAANLRALGYETLATVVGAHDRELKLEPQLFSEANIVFVADKLVKETTLVKIERRYEGALKRFPPETEIGKLIMKDSKSALMLLQCYVEITGDTALLDGTDTYVRESYAKS